MDGWTDWLYALRYMRSVPVGVCVMVGAGFKVVVVVVVIALAFTCRKRACQKWKRH